MNLKAVADAIAGQFVAVSATSNDKTETVTATASLPNTVTKLALLVYPPTGSLGIGVSRLREDELTFPVKLLRDPLSMPARTDFLYAWYDALRDQVEKNVDLDLAYVAWARNSAVRVEIDGEDYAKETFDVIEFEVTVRFNEVVTTVSA